jgi:hypothetical protein
MNIAVRNPRNIKNNPAAYKATIEKTAEHLGQNSEVIGIILRDGTNKLNLRGWSTQISKIM